MSEFDKEAEREKLRKQFEAEEQERESTRRMSELLLKGATMTNKHCNRCGDPIFRYDGQEFCPTCQAAGQAAAVEEAPETVDAETAPAAESGVEPDQSAEAAAAGDETAPPEETTTQPPASPAEASRRAPPSRTGESLGRDDGEEQTPESGPASAGQRTGASVPTRTTTAGATDADADAAGDGEFDEAEAAIVATIRRFSDAAATTDDPARAREYLTTVREAADALDALRR
ncbi:Sjogren's syndrome/scleroderma autoantigen 1 family protein [Haloarchaeobius sp. HRN-SO-5]|uniref:Sjogren's syndrome/scleroderma autoantigen 1 family protein n=1 Tax=Haloarchaeobius sp. HRN-SO-5 TaxID=3446118 RepID=UPI003EBB9C81